ncbi:MAG TPA: hypothetical protein VHN18_00925 [Micromonosporaceae bacterium]|nr:hypothetical protein [Micromonosporaceae bacterium]
MFGSSRLSRRDRAEQVGEQAWQQLVARVASAGDTARSATRSSTRLADNVGGRVSSVTDEALYRANAALDALAGRRPGLPWSWIAGAAMAGIAAGLAAGAAGGVATRTALSRKQSADPNGRVEFVDVDRPSAPVSLDR